MARTLQDFNPEVEEVDEVVEENWLTRTTARAFAAALSALLIATLVVTRSSEALTIDGTVAGSALSSGTIALVDDDSGEALFDFSDLAPGRPLERCLEVVYEGSITPVDLSLTAESLGELARFMNLSVEEGSGAGFETCEGFSATSTLYEGTLQEFSSGSRLELGRLLNSGDSRSYRIVFDLQDVQEALGLAATADFIWEVTPS